MAHSLLCREKKGIDQPEGRISDCGLELKDLFSDDLDEGFEGAGVLRFSKPENRLLAYGGAVRSPGDGNKVLDGLVVRKLGTSDEDAVSALCIFILHESVEGLDRCAAGY